MLCLLLLTLIDQLGPDLSHARKTKYAQKERSQRTRSEPP